MNKVHEVNVFQPEQSIKELFVKPKRGGYYKIVGNLGEYQADLTFFDVLSRYNHGYTGILNIIHVPSRYLYAYAFKAKSDTYELFLKFLDDLERDEKQINTLVTDSGTEFLNNKMKAVLTRDEIIHIYSTVKNKTSIVERVNRTIRDALERLFAITGKWNWVDYLDSVVSQYNEKSHRSLVYNSKKYAPKDFTEIMQLAKNKADSKRNSIIESIAAVKFKKGNIVRIRETRNQFAKGAEPKWSKEVYTIIGPVNPVEVLISNGDTVNINNLLISKGETVKPAEVQIKKLRREKLVKKIEKKEGIDRNNILSSVLRTKQTNVKVSASPEPPTESKDEPVYEIEKVIKYDPKRKQYLVKWKGYKDLYWDNDEFSDIKKYFTK